MSSTFAPPTGPPVSAVTPTHEVEPLPATASGGGRRSFVIVAAILAVIALGVGAFVAITGGRSDADVAEPYSLIAAAESTISARTVDFDLTVSAAGVEGLTVSGAVDNDSRLVSVTTDLSSLLALGDASLPFDGTEITVLVDASNGVVYLDAAALGGFLPGDAAWVSIDLSTLAEQSGQSLDDLLGEFALDPTDIARTLLDAGSATEVGVDRIDGVDVQHYRVDVDVAAALADLPQADVGPALGDIELPDTVAYDVWVTADNQLRRVTFDIDVAGQSIGMQLDMTTSGEPLDVQLPDPSEVVDLTGLLGF
jgi:hypothetical protein